MSIKILYEKSRMSDKILATVVNTISGRRFHISAYPTIEKAEKLAPIWVAKKIKVPTRQFKEFLKKKSNYEFKNSTI